MTGKISTCLLAGFALASVSACTSVPKPSGFLSSYDSIDSEDVRGTRAKRLQSADVETLPADATLYFEQLDFVPVSASDNSLTSEDEQVLLNHFARSLCSGLSKRFVIAQTPAEGQYVLRAAILDVRTTERFGAALSTVSGFILPLGVRPPVGLGGLTAEFEILDPSREPVASMIWTRKADVASANPGVSRIGDAYGFASLSAREFSKMLPKRDDSADDEGRENMCERYGKNSWLATAALGFIGGSARMIDGGANEPVEDVPITAEIP